MRNLWVRRHVNVWPHKKREEYEMNIQRGVLVTCMSISSQQYSCLCCPTYRQPCDWLDLILDSDPRPMAMLQSIERVLQHDMIWTMQRLCNLVWNPVFLLGSFTDRGFFSPSVSLGCHILPCWFSSVRCGTMEGGDVAMLTDSVALCLLTTCRVFGPGMESLHGTFAYASLLLILSQPSHC